MANTPRSACPKLLVMQQSSDLFERVENCSNRKCSVKASYCTLLLREEMFHSGEDDNVAGCGSVILVFVPAKTNAALRLA